jgi:hypothetical protein
MESNGMTLDEFLEKVKSEPETVTLDVALKVIEENYEFSPVGFSNGGVKYEAGQNIKTCQLLAFGEIHGLTKSQTLSCYGSFYRTDVLGHPDGTDHEPIRKFMKHGWKGVKFDSRALKSKGESGRRG